MSFIDSILGLEQINTRCTRQIQGLPDSRVIAMLTGGLDKPGLLGLLTGGHDLLPDVWVYLSPTFFLQAYCL
jgi:hypothetical protein